MSTLPPVHSKIILWRGALRRARDRIPHPNARPSALAICPSHEPSSISADPESPARSQTGHDEAWPSRDTEKSLVTPATAPISNPICPRISQMDADFGIDSSTTNLHGPVIWESPSPRFSATFRAGHDEACPSRSGRLSTTNRKHDQSSHSRLHRRTPSPLPSPSDQKPPHLAGRASSCPVRNHSVEGRASSCPA